MSANTGVKESKAFKALIEDVRREGCVIRQNGYVGNACGYRRFDQNAISTIEPLLKEKHVALGNKLSPTQDEYALLYDTSKECSMRKFLNEVANLRDKKALVLSHIAPDWVKELRRVAKAAFPGDRPK